MEELGIKFYNSTLAYTQSNGQDESFNKIVLNWINTKLNQAKGKWVKELSSIL